MKVGTVSRTGQYVRGDCERPEPEGHALGVLLYLIGEEDVLVCAEHYRRWAQTQKHVEVCDECGADFAWRDPLTRKNEFFCAKCHAKHGTVFANRWADKARQSTALGFREKVQCAAAGYGTDCKGEIKWRGAHNKSLCNRHAGKQGVGPNG